MEHDVPDIMAWASMLGHYNEENFFFLVRNYLGPVSTPFHKPALIDRLSAFFLNDLHQERMLSMLDELDIRMLSAAWLLDLPTEETLTNLFVGDQPYAQVQRKVVNLEERLLLMPTDKVGGSPKLAINPLLRQRLAQQRLSIRSLLTFREPAETDTPHRTPTLVDSETVMTLCNLIIQHVYPTTLTMQIRFLEGEQSAAIFPALGLEQRTTLLQSLVPLLQGLGIVSPGMDVDLPAADMLLGMPHMHLLACLIASDIFLNMHMPTVQAAMALTMDALGAASTLTQAFTTDSFLRLLKILAIRNGAHPTQEQLEAHLRFLHALGIFTDDGQGTTWLTPAARSLLDGATLEHPSSALTIDSDFTVSYVPGSGEHGNLLYVFGLVRSSDVVTTYEITRTSFRNALDTGISFEAVVAYLQQNSAHGVPPNLMTLLGEWYASYHSVRIYDGIVVSCDMRMSRIVDSHPQLQQYILQRIAEGVYLFSRENEHQWRYLLRNAGADMLPRTLYAQESPEPSHAQEIPMGCTIKDFAMLVEHRAPTIFPNTAAVDYVDPPFMEELRTIAQGGSIKHADVQELVGRIDNKLVVDISQMTSARLYTGVQTASGFDFRGKVNLCKTAIAMGNMVIEVHIYDNDEQVVDVVKPIEVIDPTSKDARLRALVLPSMEELSIPVSRMFLVKVRRLSLL